MSHYQYCYVGFTYIEISLLHEVNDKLVYLIGIYEQFVSMLVD